MSAIATGQQSDDFVDSSQGEWRIRGLDGLSFRQLSPYSVVRPHMPATAVSSRDAALATEQPQYCAQREYSVALA